MKDFIYLFTPWWGKMLGVPLGFLVAGPAGAVFGILVGNVFDIGLYNFLHAPQWHHYRKASSQIKNVFLPALFQIMGHIAKTDGQVQPNDIKIARKIIKEIRLFGANKRLAMKYYNEGKASSFDFEQKLRDLKQLCYYHPELLSLFCKTQYRAAQVGYVSNNKKDRVNIVYNLLGYEAIYPDRSTKQAPPHTKQKKSQQNGSNNQQQQYHHRSRYQNSKPQTDYEILDIQEGERSELVKKAYRKLISKNHPDKLIARNASQHEIEMATEKTQLIQAAYERIKKSRGF